MTFSQQIARAMLIGGLINLASCATASWYWSQF